MFRGDFFEQQLDICSASMEEVCCCCGSGLASTVLELDEATAKRCLGSSTVKLSRREDSSVSETSVEDGEDDDDDEADSSTAVCDSCSSFSSWSSATTCDQTGSW